MVIRMSHVMELKILSKVEMFGMSFPDSILDIVDCGTFALAANRLCEIPSWFLINESK